MKQKILLLLATVILCLAGISAMAAPETEPNNTRATANTLALGGSNTGAINVSGDEDWFKVTTTGDGKLNVTINVSNGLNLWCYVYDNNGTTLLASNYTTATLTLSPDGLATGTYYIRLVAYYTGQLPAYTVSNTLTQPAEANDAEPNNTKAQAKVLLVNKSKTGHIDYYYNNLRDTFDWYKITTTQDGRLRLKMTSGNGQNVWAYLYDNDGTTQLGAGYTTGSAVVVNADGLAAGTYYVRVNTYYNYEFAPYTIEDSLFTPAEPNDIEPNNTKAQALTMPLNGSVKGHIDYYNNNLRDTFDWYKVTTNADGRLRLTMHSGNGQNVYATLFDNNGTTQLATGYTTGNAVVVNQDGLAAGTYYIRVNTYYNYEFAPYTLDDSLFKPAQTNDAEPNNTKAQAVVFAPNSTVKGHTNYYYNNLKDTFDWYQLTIPDDGNINVSITSNNGQNVYASLYDNDGTTLLDNLYTTGTINYNVDGLQAGTYYLRINTYYASEFAPYTLKNTFTTYTNTKDAEVNNSPYQAATMPANQATTGHVNFYYNGQKDAVDWYKINYTGSGNLTLNMSQEAHISNAGLVYYYVQVYKDTLAAPIANQYSVAASWQINLSSLTQGYYYVKVFTYYSYEFASYNITPTFTQVNVASIQPKAYDTLSSCSSTNSITFQPRKSSKPYTVQLYRFGIAYGSPVITSKVYVFKNLPTGSYFATAYGDGATGTAFGKSRSVSVEPVPANLSTTNITNVKATLNWTAVTCAGYYTVQYRVQGNPTWTTKKTKNTNPNYLVKGLTASTTYEWQVATSDSANGIVATGAYSSISTFTTASAYVEGNDGDGVSLFGKGNIKDDKNSISVFPNPASNYFTIRYSSTTTERVNAMLYNMSGKAVWTSGAMNASALNGQKVAVSQFASGIYYLKIMDEKGTIQSVIKVSIIK